MTQPNDPTEAVPTRALHDDATGRPGPPPRPAEPTARLTPAQPTPRPDPVEPTVQWGPPQPTVQLGAGESTVHLGAGELTVQLGGAQPAAQLGTAEPTVHPGAWELTVQLGGAQPTAELGGAGPTVGAAEPTAHLAADSGTVGSGATVPTGPPTAEMTTWPVPGRPTGRAADPTSTAAAPDAGRTTAAGTGTVYGAHTAAGGGHRTAAGSGAAAPRGAEVRFGPGVPATPPAAPAWPTPPPRRRSVWRTVTSVLSALLTVALLAAVGVYLWQRISPLEISGVTVAVPEPAGDRCDVTVEVVATVRTNGRRGVVEYQWLRSGSPPSSMLTERVGRGQRSVDLTLEWTFSGVGSTRQTATVNIISPAPLQAQTEVAYDCRG
ncbi:hypothetical protein ACVCAH_19210 [Micromonospora sp. LZ34]